jgi:hypothetical protein
MWTALKLMNAILAALFYGVSDVVFTVLAIATLLNFWHIPEFMTTHPNVVWAIALWMASEIFAIGGQRVGKSVEKFAAELKELMGKETE